jgi:TonB family protein
VSNGADRFSLELFHFALGRHIIRHRMRQNTSIVWIFACFFVMTGGWSAAKEEAPSPDALISRARLQEEIWTDGTPPMLMRAEIQVSDSKGALVKGQYTFHWASPSRWREDIQIANYERIRVRDVNGYWQKSGLAYQPQSIFELDTLLHLKDALKVGPRQTLGKTKTREKDGVRQNCTEVKWGGSTDRTLCFDKVTGALLSVEYASGENPNLPQISRIEYEAFTSVGGKLVPYEIRALRDRKVYATVKVLEISKIADEDPSVFNAPPNSEFWAQCGDVQDRELVATSPPKYPPGARANHESGRVIFYAVVEADGSLSHTAIIQRATPGLEAAATEALRQWRYKPASCGQTPLRTETSIAMDFWLEPG